MTIRNFINHLISSKNHCCCLCLQSMESPAALVQDEIVFENSMNTEEIVNMLTFVLGADCVDALSMFSDICEKCKESLINSYTIIKMCKNNFEQLRKAVDGILDNISFPFVLNPGKSLFVCLNTTDFVTESYYDEEQFAASQKTALKRLNVLRTKQVTPTFDVDVSSDVTDVCSSPKVENEEGNKKQFHKRKKNLKVKQAKSLTTSIPTSDMMADKDSLKCKLCLKMYATSQNLRQHYFKVHAPKNYRCSICSKAYGTEGLLGQHKYQSHSPAVCSKCGKVYQNRHSLREHELGHMSELICSDCGRSYKHRKTFNKHLLLKICQQKKRKSNADAKYICDYCKQKFCHKPSLRVHIIFKHGNGKAHVCPWCSKKFHAPSQLKSHVVKHTQEKKFSCDLCGGKFVTKESLLYHIRIHTGEKPYKCHLCEERFLSSSRRLDHIRRHHMSPSLECEICHRKFKNRSCLTRHKKRHFNPKSKLHCLDKITETENLKLTD